MFRIGPPRNMFASIIVALLFCSQLQVNALSAENRKFAEIPPLKAAMLTKSWQGLMLDVEEKVGVVPELGSTSVSTRRDGPELPRRQLCKRQFEQFYESAFAMALADKNPPVMAMKKRKTIKSLVMDNKLVGPDCTTFASLTQPATMAMVVTFNNEWSILALTVNPTERNMEAIVSAESAMLKELRNKAKDAGASLRIKATAKETLAGSEEQLSLVPQESDGDDSWFRC